MAHRVINWNLRFLMMYRVIQNYENGTSFEGDISETSAEYRLILVNDDPISYCLYFCQLVDSFFAEFKHGRLFGSRRLNFISINFFVDILPDYFLYFSNIQLRLIQSNGCVGFKSLISLVGVWGCSFFNIIGNFCSIQPRNEPTCILPFWCNTIFFKKMANLWSLLPPLLGEIEICVVRLFYIKFYSG